MSLKTVWNSIKHRSNAEKCQHSSQSYSPQACFSELCLHKHPVTSVADKNTNSKRTVKSALFLLQTASASLFLFLQKRCVKPSGSSGFSPWRALKTWLLTRGEKRRADKPLLCKSACVKLGCEKTYSQKKHERPSHSSWLTHHTLAVPGAHGNRSHGRHRNKRNAENKHIHIQIYFLTYVYKCKYEHK